MLYTWFIWVLWEIQLIVGFLNITLVLLLIVSKIFTSYIGLLTLASKIWTGKLLWEINALLVDWSTFAWLTEVCISVFLIISKSLNINKYCINKAS